MTDIIETRRLLHMHPELGYDEKWTSQYVAQRLAAMGYEVYAHIAQTGVVGLRRGTSPESGVVAYRADMDALPIEEKTDVPFRSTNGCMHACGHDSHMAVALDVAKKAAAAPAAKAGIAFVFQPNEEGAPGEIPSGADLMCREGTVERFDLRKMVALHSDPTLDSGTMGICSGAIWAESGRFTVEMFGESAHAAYPERGRDALWAASQAVCAIYAALRRTRPAHPEVVSICTLSAGHAFNVIADRAAFEGIIRATSRAALDAIFQTIRTVAQGIAAATQTRAEARLHYGAHAVTNDDGIVAAAREIWTQMGCAKNVGMNMAAEDFSYFSRKIPSFYAMMGVKPQNIQIPPSHSDKFTIDESALPVASEAMFRLLMHLANA